MSSSTPISGATADTHTDTHDVVGMSVSASPASPCPSVASAFFPLANLQLFISRHAERVDLLFGMDWFETAFPSHADKERNQKMSADRTEDSDDEDTHTNSHYSKHSSTDSTNSSSNSSKVGRYSTYVRHDLNYPIQIPLHLPPRPPLHYRNDSPLTELGHFQAKMVGSSLHGTRITIVYSSPALRCVQTAHEMVEALGLHQADGWKGIRIERALYEWTGFSDSLQLPDFMSPQQLKACGFHVDDEYVSKSPWPLVTETERDYFVRSAQVIEQILVDYHQSYLAQVEGRHTDNDGKMNSNMTRTTSMTFKGNILVVAHACSHDSCTHHMLRSPQLHAPGPFSSSAQSSISYSASSASAPSASASSSSSSESFTNWQVPSADQLGYQVRSGLHVTFCSIARLRFNSKLGQWKLADDKRFSFMHSRNDECSFYHRYQNFGDGKGKRKSLQEQFKYNEPMEKHLNESRINSTDLSLAPSGLSFKELFGAFLTLSHSVSSRIANQQLQRHNINTEIRRLSASILDSDGNIKKFLPEWYTLNSYLDGYIGRHIIRMFISVDLLLGPYSLQSEQKSEFSALPRWLKNALSWCILLHDISKEAWKNDNDEIVVQPSHPFQSAATAAQILHRLGFSSNSSVGVAVKEWAEKARSAVIHNEATGQNTQDNSKIPQLLRSLRTIFGTNTLSALIIESTLLHHSINWLPSIPAPAPLKDEELIGLLSGGLIQKDLITILAPLALVNSASYNVENPQKQEAHMEEIRKSISKLYQMYENYSPKHGPSSINNSNSKYIIKPLSPRSH